MGQDNRYKEYSPSRYELISSEITGLPEKGLVIEFGCASGETLKELASFHKKVEVVGFDLELVQNLNFEAYQCDMNDFDFESYESVIKKADIFLILDVLEHLIDPWSFLEKLLHYSKNGSSIIITCPNFRSIRFLLAYFRGELPLKEFGFFDKTHIRWLTPQSLTKRINSKNYDHSHRYLKSKKMNLKLLQYFWPSRFCSQFLLHLKIDRG